MKLANEKQTQFESFAKYVKDQLPKLKDDEEIIQNMCELVGIEKGKVVKALQWQNPPTIKIVKDLKCVSESGDNGCFRNANPEFIEVDENVVKLYEAGQRRNYRETKKNNLPEVAVVLLHELVH